MTPRGLDGTALLVAGHGPHGGTDPSAVHTLGQIGEALLATGASWHIRRLSAASGERYAADRGTLKRHIDELVHEPARAALLVMIGAIVEVDGEPALVTGPQAHEYPEDATLSLAWIRERLRAANAEQIVVVLSATGDAGPRAWLDELGTDDPQHLIAIDGPAAGAPIAEAVLAGLCGEALDPRTGTVTMASLGEFLAAEAPRGVLQACTEPDTIVQPPPLGGLWDVRRSQLSLRRGHRRPAPAGAGEPDELLGSVLPGRFRIDDLVARGTFGTVYRARQLAVERDVAVKVLHPDIDPSSEDGRLFVHEIRSVGRIDHANVVRIYQADITHDGRLFFAMELLRGRDLQELAAEAPLPRVRAVGLTRQLLAGLGAAHDAGLVHADVKPANAIVVDKDGGERVVLVDFGLSRLRSPDRPAESAGGTPAYMAPEQLVEGRVDARSDLYSAALVLVHLLTGWRRPNALALTPPLEQIVDADLRRVLERALALDPAQRFQTARAFAAALVGSPPAPAAEAAPPLRPFRHLAPLTEADRGRLHGRESDLAVLTEHVLYRRSVIYTAPSGVGKTSVLRAGLLPRLEALGARAVYHRCRGDNAKALADAITPNAETIADAIARWHERGGGKLVILIDQIESALSGAGAGALVRDVLGFERWPATADVAVVLTVRDDYLARLVATTQDIESGMPIVRLPPLGLAGARDAIVAPLVECRLWIEDVLLDQLLFDLERAAAAIGPEMGWGDGPAVYPPHLQLACSVLYESLGPADIAFTLEHYRALGGFDAIVGEHLDRVLETELADGRDVIARDLFLALVTNAHERAMRSEAELLGIVGAHHHAREVEAVLEALRSRGLLVRVRDAGGEPGWELVHDSLVPRVLAWIDRRDLDRRRAIELLRYHLRRSRPDAPSLLGRAELRELRPYGDAIAELDAEWARRDAGAGVWTPSRLVERSKQVLRRRTATVSSLFAVTLAVASFGMYRNHASEQRAAREASLRERDLGRFVLSLEPFDWDPVAMRALAVPAHTLPELRWELRAPDREEPRQAGERLAPDVVLRGRPTFDGGRLVERVEAHGGPAFLVITRGPCAPSIVPLRDVPGYAARVRELPVLRVRVPTCRASSATMVALAGGSFIYGGVGEPLATEILNDPLGAPAEQRVVLPAFSIDRTEITNAEFAVFADMAALTGIAAAPYPDSRELRRAGSPRFPRAGQDWYEARAYCEFLGKELPTSKQWTRALRGGELLADGSPNPLPGRNLPWGGELVSEPANLRGVGPEGPTEVGRYDADRSPDGVLDLAGNVHEWTGSLDISAPGMRLVRGGSWETEPDAAHERVAVETSRAAVERSFSLGFRCASSPR